MPRKKRVLGIVTASPPTPTLPTPKQKNKFALVLDYSSSMGISEGLRRATVKAFNDNIASMKDVAKNYGIETDVSFYTFSDNVTRVFSAQPIERLNALADHEYRPYGNTALFDAVGQAIEDFERSPDAKDPNTSFVILATTDGEENASRAFREGRRSGGYGPSLRDLMDRVQRTERYTIAFLVPRGYGNALAAMGIPRGNIREWDQTETGIREAQVATAMAFDSLYATRSADPTIKSVKNFYQTDLSTLKKSDLSKFDDLSANFKSMTVDKEQDITSFIEASGKKFVLGAGYYMVTKKEKLRAGRNVLVQEKGSRKVYGGAQARQLLGIPAGEVDITPGNHSNYDVYFQSTSRNRKLVRGTKLLYDVTKLIDDAETWDSAGAKAAADAKKAAQAAAAAQST